MICAICSIGRLYASIFSGDTSTLTSRLGAPDIATVPTPLTLLSGLAIPSSSILYRAPVLSFAVADSTITGIISELNFNNIGSSTPSGKNPLIISTLSRTSFMISVMSDPYSNSRNMIDILSREFERMCLMFSVEFNASSSGRVTFASTSSAPAPGYGVITDTMLISISGYKSTGN